MPQNRRPGSAPVAAAAIGGSHELGQNLLIDKRFPAAMADILRHAPPQPVLELGAGNGAITEALVAIRASVTAIDLDPRNVSRLRRKFSGRVEIIQGDMLTFDYGPRSHNVVSNVPFGITTPFLRHLLKQNHWHTAVLLLQWEVARKRAGVGGTTMLTASWWPWYDFSLGLRVPAAAFAPRPSVDGGILIIRRREEPLIAVHEQQDYQQLVRNAFTGKGRGLAAVLRGRLPARTIRNWLSDSQLHGQRLPRDLTAENWASLHDLHRDGTATPQATALHAKGRSKIPHPGADPGRRDRADPPP
jgi:23S rRNA (adenine-N6)-dimethyltransferase